MGTTSSQNEGNEVNMKAIHLTPEEQAKVDSSSHKPAVKYAVLAKEKPTLPPVVMSVAEKEKGRKRLTKNNRENDFDELPLYELVNMPGCFYEGGWKKGKQHGQGKIYTTNGVYYEGEFTSGVAECEDGILVCPDGSHYRGNFDDNAFEGLGRFVYSHNGTTYEGEWHEDKPHGRGFEIFQDRSEYKGPFLNGKKHGSDGVFRWANGKIYEGEFVDGEMHGEGRLYFQGKKSEFRGTFERGLKKSGSLVTEYGTYTGNFEFGEMHDKKGVFRWHDGKVFEGGFEFGEMHGLGSITFPKNGITVKGNWERGQNVKVEKIQGN